MYYTESESLIVRSPSDKGDLIALDRAIARSYGASGYGWCDDASLQIRTKLDGGRLATHLRKYERAGVITPYHPLECSHGHLFDPGEHECPDCHEAAANGVPSLQSRYRISRQPIEPVFDPTTTAGPYDIFVSYRHGDTKRLAADLFYSFIARGRRVFLDSGIIPPGVDFAQVFLPAASATPHFIFLASPTYFDSTYCKDELAHSLRSAKNVIPVPVGTPLRPPRLMPWLASMNTAPIVADGSGLSRDLEDYLQPIVQQPHAPSNYSYRLDACIYLLQRMGRGDLLVRFATSNWLSEIINQGTGPANWIVSVRQEIGGDTTRLNELCAALAP